MHLVRQGGCLPSEAGSIPVSSAQTMSATQGGGTKGPLGTIGQVHAPTSFHLLT